MRYREETFREAQSLKLKNKIEKYSKEVIIKYYKIKQQFAENENGVTDLIFTLFQQLALMMDDSISLERLDTLEMYGIGVTDDKVNLILQHKYKRL